MPLPPVLHARWPQLAARLEGLDPAAAGELSVQGGRRRLMVRGQSLVSPADPRREALRWAEGALAGEAPGRLHLLGHGVGWELQALLERGVGRLWLHADEPGLLRFALEHWECPAVLEDPRLELVADAEDCVGLGRPGDQLLETPFWRRHFPEACAERRALLGCLRSAGLRLKVLVVEPLYGGSLPMARSAAAALRGLGHEVRSLDFQRLDGARAALQGFADHHPAGAPLAADFTRLLGRMLMIEARDFAPDLVLGLAQSPFTPEAAQAIRAAGARAAFWFVEDWETLDYWRGLHGCFDLFLTIQRGRFHEELARLAPDPVRYLPACADPGQCFPEPWGEGEPPRLSFVGAGYHNRERLFLQLLDLPFKVWGSDWGLGGPLGALVQEGGRRTTPADNRRIFSGSAVNLNLHSSGYHAGVNPQGDFVNPRAFEILACGGFQLCDRRSLMAGLLEPGRDLLCYESAEELRALAAHWLPRAEERRAVADRGRRTVLARHTYAQRMAQLLELLLLEQPEAFPHAARRQQLEREQGDPELEAWLAALPAEVPRELDAVADWLRARRSPLDETGAVLLYMREMRDWARAKGLERALELAQRG
jgi:spore maturation protein CgeB